MTATKTRFESGGIYEPKEYINKAWMRESILLSILVGKAKVRWWNILWINEWYFRWTMNDGPILVNIQTVRYALFLSLSLSFNFFYFIFCLLCVIAVAYVIKCFCYLQWTKKKNMKWSQLVTNHQSMKYHTFVCTFLSHLIQKMVITLRTANIIEISVNCILVGLF